jgi:type IV pilus assembly protein PilN
MRIPINLASEPFRHERAAMVAATVFGLVLLVLAGAQGYLIAGERERASENRDAVAKLNAQLAAISRQRTEADATLREPMNEAILEQSVLLNALMERKSISWARLFADIEGVLPNNVRLIQVRLPQINSRNEVTLDMEVGAQSPDAASEFTMRLQESALFGPATLLRQEPPTEQEPLYRYRLTVSYGQKL